jgi:foldase protein PrsA
MQQPATRRRSRLIIVIALLAAVFFLAAAALYGWERFGKPEVLAIVNGESITKEDLYQEMYAQAGHETLEMLITQALILQEGRENNIEITGAEIEARLDEVIQRGFTSRDNFMDFLQAHRLKLEDIERQIRVQLTAERLLADQITVDEDEARAYFETHRDQFGQPERLKARHILVETREEAESVRAALAAGAEFAELAREKSKDSLTAGAGGNLGVINYGTDLPSWQRVLFDLDEGALSNVLESPSGFHVVEVLEKLPAEDPSFEDVEEKVYRLLREQEMQLLYPSWVDSLRAKADIKYTE